jgi:ribosomal protein S27AE
MRKKELPVQVQTFTVTRKITLEEKTCPQCGNRFLGRKNKKFCSRACVRKATYEKHGDEYRQARVKKYRAEKVTAAAR